MTPRRSSPRYGLVAIERMGQDGHPYPYLLPVNAFSSWTMARGAMWSGGPSRSWTTGTASPSRPPPKGKKLKPVTHDTWNAIIVGNKVAQNLKFSEYDGRIPYVPLFNTYIPGVPFVDPNCSILNS
jgi:hypothetical protein